MEKKGTKVYTETLTASSGGKTGSSNHPLSQQRLCAGTRARVHISDCAAASFPARFCLLFNLVLLVQERRVDLVEATPRREKKRVELINRPSGTPAAASRRKGAATVAGSVGALGSRRVFTRRGQDLKPSYTAPHAR